MSVPRLAAPDRNPIYHLMSGAPATMITVSAMIASAAGRIAAGIF